MSNYVLLEFVSLRISETEMDSSAFLKEEQKKIISSVDCCCLFWSHLLAYRLAYIYIFLPGLREAGVDLSSLASKLCSLFLKMSRGLNDL